MLDINSYFSRIGYSPERVASLETLKRLHLMHTMVIPFENLSPLLGEPVALDIESLQDKLVRRGRGGYCFEHNLLFAEVLRLIGFDVTMLSARVRWNVPDHVITPRTHMLLLVTSDEGTFLADVGFGGLTLTAPLRLEFDVEQPTPHEPFRILRSGEEYRLEAKLPTGWTRLYDFDLQRQFVPDYEVANWYVSNHPNSLFLQNLLAARPAADRRYALLNNRFTVHHADGRSETSLLPEVADVTGVLETVFSIRLPHHPEMSNRLGRLVTSAEKR